MISLTNAVISPKLGGVVAWCFRLVRAYQGHWAKILVLYTAENFCPRSAPNVLCKRIIFQLPFSFDVPSQRGSESTVSGIRQSFFLKIGSEFLLARRLAAT